MFLHILSSGGKIWGPIKIHFPGEKQWAVRKRKVSVNNGQLYLQPCVLYTPSGWNAMHGEEERKKISCCTSLMVGPGGDDRTLAWQSKYRVNKLGLNCRLRQLACTAGISLSLIWLSRPGFGGHLAFGFGGHLGYNDHLGFAAILYFVAILVVVGNLGFCGHSGFCDDFGFCGLFGFG